MRFASLVLSLGLLLPSTMIGQSRVTTLAGYGNSFGGLGVLADVKAFGSSSVSLMVGAGMTDPFFRGDDGEPNPWTDFSASSIAVAFGLRGNVGHGGHQGFLELALLPVAADVVELSAAEQRIEMLYGPGVQLGYRATFGSGVTFNAMGGAGYAINSDVVASRWKPLVGVGLGYAWRR